MLTEGRRPCGCAAPSLTESGASGGCLVACPLRVSWPWWYCLALFEIVGCEFYFHELICAQRELMLKLVPWKSDSQLEIGRVTEGRLNASARPASA